jgi:CheY-like chemotaxis protein
MISEDAYPAGTPDRVLDDRETITEGDSVLLVVEGNSNSGWLVGDSVRARGVKMLSTVSGTEALEFARQYRPTAILLDVSLPDISGWAMLSQLKQDLALRHIPVQILSLEDDSRHALARGAFSHLTKPATAEELQAAVSRLLNYASVRRRRLLIVEDNPSERLSITELLLGDDVEAETVDTGIDALERLRGNTYDCMVLDLHLPDLSGLEVLKRIREDEDIDDLPIVVFTGKELTDEEDRALHELARTVVLKGVESPERLLDETTLFLHRSVDQMGARWRKLLEKLHSSDEHLSGKRVLIVDDDVRNIFALSSVLERRGMTVVTATTGRQAIHILEETPGIAITLMDIMMPEMDGYETMRAVRKNSRYARLPIIALTAKAMKGDREKCLQAGASDYLAKPVNTDQLFSVLRTWLYR